MAIWNTKFDHKNGETRQCKECGETFHAKKPVYTCQPCQNKKQKVVEQKKRAQYQKKDNYPFDTRTNEAGARFHRIQRELRKAWIEFKKTGDKSIVTQHYDKQIKEIEENGIMKWIIDRRDKETLEAKQSKSRNNIQKDYPNHHDYYEY
jgi:hypothetical protein